MDRAMFRAAVFIIIRDDQGRVLLQRRANTGYLDGHYDFPGGHVEDGESFVETGLRELAEEVGLKTEAADLQLLHLSQNFVDVAYINVMFTATNWSGTPAIMEPHKCDDLHFFNTSELPEKCSLAVRIIERAGFDAPISTTSIDSIEFETLVNN